MYISNRVTPFLHRGAVTTKRSDARDTADVERTVDAVATRVW